MADIHLLDRVDPDRFRVIFHFPVPTGVNPAGITWALAYLRRNRLNNAGAAPATIMTVGDGTGGTILQAEADAIAAATVLERLETIALKSGGSSPAEVLATVRAAYAASKDALFARLALELNQFGRTDSAE